MVLVCYLFISNILFNDYRINLCLLWRRYDFDIKFYLFLLDLIKNFLHLKPKDLPKFLLLVVINSLHRMLILEVRTNPNLQLGCCLHVLYKFTNLFHFLYNTKNKNKEHIGYKIWFALFIDNIILITAMIFFETPVSDKYLTPEESQKT